MAGGGCGQTCATPSPANVFDYIPAINFTAREVYSDVEDTSVGGDLSITDLASNWFGALRNTVGGSATFSDITLADPDENEIVHNLSVGGNLICENDSPAVQFGDSGQSEATPVGGYGAGQCAFNRRVLFPASPRPSTCRWPWRPRAAVGTRWSRPTGGSSATAARTTARRPAVPRHRGHGRHPRRHGLSTRHLGRCGVGLRAPLRLLGVHPRSQPPDRRHGGGAGGWWLRRSPPTAASSRTAAPPSTGRPARSPSTGRSWAWPRLPAATATGWSRTRRRHLLLRIRRHLPGLAIRT